MMCHVFFFILHLIILSQLFSTMCCLIILPHALYKTGGSRSLFATLYMHHQSADQTAVIDSCINAHMLQSSCTQNRNWTCLLLHVCFEWDCSCKIITSIRAEINSQLFTDRLSKRMIYRGGPHTDSATVFCRETH